MNFDVVVASPDATMRVVGQFRFFQRKNLRSTWP